MRLTIAFVAICIPTTAQSQAFGVVMGSPISAYNGKSTGNTNHYTITVPLPNSEFDTYTAVATQKTGICKVSGLGKTHENDSYGYSIRSAFTQFQSSLEKKYGNYKSFDFLNAGSIWKEPNEFGWSIYKKERTLASFWDNDEGSNNLGNITGILLDSKAISPEKTYLTISYEFVNFSECQKYIKDNDSSGL